MHIVFFGIIALAIAIVLLVLLGIISAIIGSLFWVAIGLYRVFVFPAKLLSG